MHELDIGVGSSSSVWILAKTNYPYWPKFSRTNWPLASETEKTNLMNIFIFVPEKKNDYPSITGQQLSGKYGKTWNECEKEIFIYGTIMEQTGKIGMKFIKFWMKRVIKKTKENIFDGIFVLSINEQNMELFRQCSFNKIK